MCFRSGFIQENARDGYATGLCEKFQSPIDAVVCCDYCEEPFSMLRSAFYSEMMYSKEASPYQVQVTIHSHSNVVFELDDFVSAQKYVVETAGAL